MMVRGGVRTFLFTDVEGSTHLLRKHSGVYPQVIAIQRRLIIGEAKRHGGIPLGHEGDSCFIVFEDPEAAIAAAAGAQRALLSFDWPDDASVRVRFGLHTGAAEISGDDYFGLSVHLASRVSDSGHGGQIIVSGHTRDLVTSGEWSWQDKGTHHLRGIEAPVRLFQLEGPGLPREFPPLRSFLAAPALRVPSTSFVGRRADSEEIARMLEEARLVTVLGPGGIGKTRLALNVGTAYADAHPDGVWFADLTSTDDPAAVADVIAEAAGISVQAGAVAVSAIGEFFARKNALLIIDNFEHVIRAARVVSRLLEGTSALRILTTSRERLRISGEHVFVAKPLTLGSRGSAVLLFCARARAVKPDFEPSADDLDAIGRVCAQLDGLPLAIELAAAQCRLFTPTEIARRLAGRVMSLSGGSRDLHERQQTIRNTILWSYQLLTDAERDILAVLAVFAGPAQMEVIEAVAGKHRDTEAALTGLIDKSLVHQRIGSQGESRIGTLVLVKEFAKERLAEHPHHEELPRRHAAYFTDWIGTANDALFQSHPDRWVRLIEADFPEVSHAFTWSVERERVQATRIFGSLGFFFHRTGMTHLARRWSDLVSGIDVPDDVRVGRAMATGYVRFGFRELTPARAEWTEALRLTRHLGDRRGESWALMSLAGSYIGFADDYDAAQDLARQGIRLATTVGSPVLVGLGYNVVGELARVNGDEETAEAAYLAGIEAANEIGDHLREAILHGNRVYLATHRGQLDLAVELAERAATMHLSHGQRNQLPWVSIALAGALERRGDVETACLLLGAAEESARRMLFEEMPGDVAENGRIRARIKEAAGPRFDEWRRRGADHTLDQALQLAL